MLLLDRKKERAPIADAGDNSSRPVPQLAFVFGAPRSGTTFLGKLLDSDPSVMYLHEPISKGRGLKLHNAIHCLRNSEPILAELRQQVVEDLVRSQAGFLQPPFFRKNFTCLPGESALAWGFKSLTGRPASFLAGPHRLDRVGQVVVKDGLSWFSRPLTQRLGARAIVLLRHPCAVVSSMLRGQKIGAMDRVSRTSFWTNESERLRLWGHAEADVVAMQDDEFEALRWLATCHDVPNWKDDSHIRILTFRDLMQRTGAVIEEIFPWLGLTVTDQTRAFARRKTASWVEWLRRILGPKKMYYSIEPRAEASVSAWQKELPPDSVRRVLEIVAPFPVTEYWPDPPSSI